MQKSWFLLSLFIIGPVSCTKSKKDEASAPANAAVTADQTLSKLIVMNDQIEPNFDPFVYEYTLVGGETYKNKITINTAPVNPKLDIMINGVKLRSDFTTNPMPLAAGANLFTIELVDATGQKVNSYKLSVPRVAELPDETLADLATSDGELTPPFSSEITSYQLTVGKDNGLLTVSPLANYDDEADFEINGVAYSGDKGGYDVTLNPGSNTITIVVKGKSGRSKTYTLTVTRPTT
ncbi:MAG TPA: cadherin-like beta sandwich domain-containing protein [Oligoflexus sp.]|uniref:cadherin-like beta sandwich domain-containing protein n=1 Tax=Oligoflexus sp. TaxID=1971216 RepID=UPI002D7E7B57|nr:cadherin-like beta sandwich domain-containing protein [Oligoflexus sp.]HET9240361.1 cadherin-like beta sandwich domain-containing protein [Oligoflexus sp.]